MTDGGLDRLQEVLDAYGGRPENWPPEERQGLMAFVERSAEAQQLRDAALMLDVALDKFSSPVASEELKDRILKEAAHELRSIAVPEAEAAENAAGSQTGSLLSWLKGKIAGSFDFAGGLQVRPVSLMATSLLIGLIIGTTITWFFDTGSAQANSDYSDDELIALAFGSTDLDF